MEIPPGDITHLSAADIRTKLTEAASESVRNEYRAAIVGALSDRDTCASAWSKLFDALSATPFECYLSEEVVSVLIQAIRERTDTVLLSALVLLANSVAHHADARIWARTHGVVSAIARRSVLGSTCPRTAREACRIAFSMLVHDIQVKDDFVPCGVDLVVELMRDPDEDLCRRATAIADALTRNYQLRTQFVAAGGVAATAHVLQQGDQRSMFHAASVAGNISLKVGADTPYECAARLVHHGYPMILSNILLEKTRSMSQLVRNVLYALGRIATHMGSMAGSVVVPHGLLPEVLRLYHHPPACQRRDEIQYRAAIVLSSVAHDRNAIVQLITHGAFKIFSETAPLRNDTTLHVANLIRRMHANIRELHIPHLSRAIIRGFDDDALIDLAYMLGGETTSFESHDICKRVLRECGGSNLFSKMTPRACGAMYEICRRHIALLTRVTLGATRAPSGADTVAVIVGDREFTVHRTPLMSASAPIFAMLGGGWAEGHAQKLELKNVSARAFDYVRTFVESGEDVFGSAYTSGGIELFTEILCAGDVLMMDELCKACARTLWRSITPPAHELVAIYEMAADRPLLGILGRVAVVRLLSLAYSGDTREEPKRKRSGMSALDMINNSTKVGAAIQRVVDEALL